MTAWAEALRQHWGVHATLQRLDGEFDLNFLAGEYILKVMRPGCDLALVTAQIDVLAHIAGTAPELPCPRVMPSLSGHCVLALEDEHGELCWVWVLQRLPGQCYATAPHPPELIHDLGRRLGQLNLALTDFPAPVRDFKWNLMQANWIGEHVHSVQDATRRHIIHTHLARFLQLLPRLQRLPQQCLHNDANDYNILVDKGTGGSAPVRRVSGIIDFGDLCSAPRVCEIAIAGAYIVLDHPQPHSALVSLVTGYHCSYPLSTSELDLIWPLLLTRLCVSVVNSALMAIESPDDPYIQISEAPAWRFLQSPQDDAALIAARLRTACGLPVVDQAERTLSWIHSQRGQFAELIGRPLHTLPVHSLSVEHSTTPQDPFCCQPEEAAHLGHEHGDSLWLGYYHEPRLIYTDAAFRQGPWKASDRRSVHLAIDLFAPAATTLYAPYAGEVFAIENRQRPLDYGGLVILHHQSPDGESFYTLYGHLDPASIATLHRGQRIDRGQAFAALGDVAVNGGWAPHVHCQLALSTEGMQADWPGAANPDDMALWSALCPNPAALLNLPDERLHYSPTEHAQVLAQRRTHFARNLSMSYREPLMLVRGWRHHMFDQWARPYLDAYNNVPHVGHAHPRIAAVATEQLRRINTNTRYLHPAQTALADKLLSTLPDSLSVCYFVNSGSEANELALRLARAHTTARGMITPDHGYHGNTTGAIDISAYKFNAPGGVGPSDWVQLIDVADDYRGRFGRHDPHRAQKFADLVLPAIQALHSRGHRLAGFIAETFPSVGGQIIPPQGYLQQVYAHIRAAGGVCIADEVQTGLGRLGEYYFGFEQQGVVPDIVVLGKPIGNGHPIGVVVTTADIAAHFAQGPEFFSTFGGSTLSCRIAKEVLDIIDDEALQANASAMGAILIDGLQQLQSQYACIGDVRGMGLFIGVEFIHPDGSEASALCQDIKEGLRERRILVGSEGPQDNILKIRPPLTIEREDVDMLLSVLGQVLACSGNSYE